MTNLVAFHTNSPNLLSYSGQVKYEYVKLLDLHNIEHYLSPSMIPSNILLIYYYSFLIVLLLLLKDEFKSIGQEHSLTITHSVFSSFTVLLSYKLLQMILEHNFNCIFERRGMNEEL